MSKFYIVKFGRTAIPTLNGRISETKRDFLDPLVPKFSYDRGLSPTLSWKWPSATLSPSFGLFQSEKPLFRGVPGVSRCLSLVRICPRDRFRSRNFFFGGNPPKKFTATFCDLFRWGIFTHFHSARLKTHYILPQLPPKGRKGVGESGEDVTSLIWPKKSHFVLFNFLFRSLWTEFSVEITFTL